MKHIPNYPVWLAAFMLLGPFFMISGVFSKHELVWVGQIAGACMVMAAFFYVSKRLHEHTEEVASLRQLLNEQSETRPGVTRAG